MRRDDNRAVPRRQLSPARKGRPGPFRPDFRAVIETDDAALLERDERCRQAMTCTCCELTDGKSKIRHDWNSGEGVREADSSEIKRLYKCWQCGCEDLRGRMQTARY